MLDAWCLMLEHLPDPATKGGGLRPPPQRGAAFGRPPLWNPLWMGLTGFFKRVETRMFQPSIYIKNYRYAAPVAVMLISVSLT